jgi:hypothetical protein
MKKIAFKNAAIIFAWIGIFVPAIGSASCLVADKVSEELVCSIAGKEVLKMNYTGEHIGDVIPFEGSQVSLLVGEYNDTVTKDRTLEIGVKYGKPTDGQEEVYNAFNSLIPCGSMTDASGKTSRFSFSLSLGKAEKKGNPFYSHRFLVCNLTEK